MMCSNVMKRHSDFTKHRSLPWNVLALIAFGVSILMPGQFVVAANPMAHFCTGADIDCATGDSHAIQLSRRWQSVGDWRFDHDLNQWKVKNFGNALKIEIVDDAILGRSLLVHRDNAEIDTGFEIASPPIVVVEGTLCRLKIVAAHTLDLTMAEGVNEEYLNRICWLNRDGRKVGTTPFKFGAPSDESWYEVTVEARAPRDAVTAVVQIGLDSPNLYGERRLRLRRIVWTAQPNLPQYVAEGKMVSRPQCLAGPCHHGRVSWQATTPDGTSVKCQVRSGADVNGEPRDWTPFTGPDGTVNSYFTTTGAELPAIHTGHVWFQYRLILGTTQAAATPVVQQVRLGDDQRWVEDRGWLEPDRSAPQLVDFAPRRTSDAKQPITFSISDGQDGVGVDLHSVEVLLDDIPITSQLKRVGKTFRYELNEPLKPVYGLVPINRWAITNYASLLTIRRGPPRVPGSADSVEVRRNGKKTDTLFALVSPGVSVQEGATYQISVWSRHTTDLRYAGGQGNPGGCAVCWLDAQGKPLGDPVRLDLGYNSPQWRQSQVKVTAPVGAHAAFMRLGWDFPDVLEGDELAFADPMFEGPHPDTGMIPNVHRVIVKSRDFAGNSCEQPWWILVQSPPKAGVTTIRDDGMVLVDGKPLFPIGLYAVGKREHNGNDINRCFAELREAGFNTVHTYQVARNAELQEFYAAADHHRLRIIVAPGAPNTRDAQAAARTVIDDCHQPAILAWYLADDTTVHIGPGDLQRVHRVIHDVDPFHITVHADGAFGGPGISRYAPYLKSTDGFMPEIYPIWSEKKCEVADVTRDMKLIVEDQRRVGRRAPIWAILGDFQGWGWERFPTEDETRVMTYLAIIHGANGVTYYTYGGFGKNHGVTYDPKVWAALKRFSHQLADLHDVLVQRNPAQKQKIEILRGPQADGAGYPAINSLLKEFQGQRYLLTANSSRSPVRAKISADAGAGPVQVMFEKRQLTAKSNDWEDDFAPYAVHVYCWPVR